MIRCAAKAKATGEQCKKAPIRGANVCRSHGGAAAQVQLAAKRRLEIQSATALVASYSHEPLSDPVSALLAVGSEIIALKDELARRASELDSLAVTDRNGAQQVAAVLQAYLQSLAQASDTLVKINRLNLEARRVFVQEAQVAACISALRRAVGKNCDLDQAERVMASFAQEIQREQM